ncbi:RNA polymerase sigma-70 factor [Pedobacter duraquae]|uniref:RNA polymerase sigma-70 factor (ECF subfamily) n=1 Tax=Pedobacter duraquae TaxID=425511 RepID=A0A4R6IBL9_9SPHI|nr:RNA polymerase sigma-70 factor [Pedobacter duraquae]TDO19600.1 RNA polymerase sigma-70 factor (ECF subfamily) [Pedobacter duraquae]
MHNASIPTALTINAQNFEEVYLEHYAALHRYAYAILYEDDMADELVQQVFVKILEKKQSFQIHVSVKAYLYRSVHNECLNYLKHEKVKKGYQEHSVGKKQYAESASKNLQYKELEQQLSKSINALPEQCRTIFQLSRFEELKYAEIALQLGLSVKTIENQISKALKRLRNDLADYLPLLLFILINTRR